jgi:hypothetical protein
MQEQLRTVGLVRDKIRLAVFVNSTGLDDQSGQLEVTINHKATKAKVS